MWQFSEYMPLLEIRERVCGMRVQHPVFYKSVEYKLYEPRTWECLGYDTLENPDRTWFLNPKGHAKKKREGGCPGARPGTPG